MGRVTEPGVPTFERRRRRRIMTLKNMAIVVGVLIAAFVAISLRSEMRGSGSRNFGRIADRDQSEVKPAAVEIVTEGSAPVGYPAPVPVLAATVPPEPVTYYPVDGIDVPVESVPDPVAANHRDAGGEGLVIVGGPEGLTAVRQKPRRPVLSGGFGRDPGDQ